MIPRIGESVLMLSRCPKPSDTRYTAFDRMFLLEMINMPEYESSYKLIYELSELGPEDKPTSLDACSRMYESCECETVSSLITLCRMPYEYLNEKEDLGITSKILLPSLRVLTKYYGYLMRDPRLIIRSQIYQG